MTHEETDLCAPSLIVDEFRQRFQLGNLFLRTSQKFSFVAMLYKDRTDEWALGESSMGGAFANVRLEGFVLLQVIYSFQAWSASN